MKQELSPLKRESVMECVRGLLAQMSHAGCPEAGSGISKVEVCEQNRGEAERVMGWEGVLVLSRCVTNSPQSQEWE
jgi:hypothetical protein